MTVKIQFKYLMHDIEQKAWRASNARFKDPETRAQSQYDSSDTDYYRREIEAAVAKLMLPVPTLKYNGADTEDTLSTTKSEWQFTVSERVDCKAATLVELMHSFVVNTVMARWADIYSPGDVVQFNSAAQSDMQSLLVNLRKIKKPSLSDYGS